jgi:hypothetical protein
MKTGLLVSILAFAAASCVALQESAPGSAEPMTVAEVSAHIARLHGQTVRISGEVNNCTSLTCRICDGPEEEDACLGLAFHADSHAAGNLVEELYRFATITIDASIDAACEVGYDADRFSSKAEAEKPNAEGRHVVVICTDRATSVRDARVVSVDARKPASLGRFDMYKGDPLQEADTYAFQKIETFLSTLPWIDDLEELQLKLYVNPEPWEGASESYYLCECFEDSCEGRWPTWSGHADTRSPANPYVCTHISRIGDNWVMS